MKKILVVLLMAGLIFIGLGNATETISADNSLQQAKEAIANQNYSGARRHAEVAVENDPTNLEVKIILDYIGQEEKMVVEAAAENDWEAVVFLSAYVVAVDATDDDGWTALMIALREGRTEVVETLIESGADVNAKAYKGATALMGALSVGNTEVVKVLTEAGADVNAKSNEGWTALMSASQEGNAEAVEALIDAGANLNIRNGRGWTALMAAREIGHTEVVNLLEKHTNE